ncbi:MAG: response regulator [Nitratireductor sp.]|nr:response regulator [Nitratireductor sp.]
MGDHLTETPVRSSRDGGSDAVSAGANHDAVASTAAGRLPGGGQTPVIDRYGKPRKIAALFLLGVAFVIAAAAASWYWRDAIGEPVLLAGAGALAGVGIFFLFLLALGFVHLSANRRGDAFYSVLVNSMESGLLVSDEQGRIVYANRAYADITGAKDALEVSGVETVFSQDAAATETIYRLSRQASEEQGASAEIRLPAGLSKGREGARWFRLRNRHMSHSDYPKGLAVWQLSDITDDRRSQERAFQELQHAINYLDHAPAGFFSSGPDGSVAYLNATLAGWLGVDLALFRPGSLKLRDFISDHGLDLIAAANDAAGENGISILDVDISVDGSGSGSARLPVRLYHKVAINGDGAPGSSRTLVINRMAEEESDSALLEAELRFTRFFNNTPIAIAAIAPSGKTVRTNAPFMRMFKDRLGGRAGGEGVELASLVQEQDRAAVGDAISEVINGGTRTRMVDAAMTGDGERFLRLFLSPVLDGPPDDDSDERVIVYALETTEHRKLEEQFAQSQKMQAVGQLAGGIAHDFNNVLTAIIGFSDLLLANHRPSDPSFQDIINIKQNANRAASLVRQLLAYSRRQTLRPQVLQLGEVLSDLRMLLERLLGDKATLKLVHGRDLWPVRADLSQLEQVVVNLCVNGRDAMPDGGEMTIRTANLSAADVVSAYSGFKEMPAADYVLLEVQDEGTGMTPEIMEKIFEPFFSTKEIGMGTGLGLSTVYGIVKQTGGFIYPESTPGEGTTFRVFLPRHVPKESDAAVPSEKARESGKDLTGNATILLVEDEDAVRAFGSRALAQRGYTVHEASSGIEALEVLEEYGDTIDLIVSDVVMPEMDGPTLLGEVRKHYPDLKFIFVSGYAEDAFARNLPEEERERFGFLAKPFSLKQLAMAVSEMLDG